MNCKHCNEPIEKKGRYWFHLAMATHEADPLPDSPPAPVNDVQRFVEAQHRLPPEFEQVLNERFWDMYEGKEMENPEVARLVGAYHEALDQCTELHAEIARLRQQVESVTGERNVYKAVLIGLEIDELEILPAMGQLAALETGADFRHQMNELKQHDQRLQILCAELCGQVGGDSMQRLQVASGNALIAQERIEQLEAALRESESARERAEGKSKQHWLRVLELRQKIYRLNTDINRILVGHNQVQDSLQQATVTLTAALPALESLVKITQFVAMARQDEKTRADYEQAVAAREAVATVIAGEGVTGWRGIESAPKDGTAILVYPVPIFGADQSCVAYWDRDKDYEAWRDLSGERVDYLPLTHWQALPAPPVVEAGEE